MFNYVGLITTGKRFLLVCFGFFNPSSFKCCQPDLHPSHVHPQPLGRDLVVCLVFKEDSQHLFTYLFLFKSHVQNIPDF